MIRTDLHIHSIHSDDADFRVDELISKCLTQGVDLFSLTDHNSVKGVSEAVSGAERAGIGFIPGIEIDCCFEGINLHVLGYGIDWQSKDFERVEEDVRGKVMESFADMIGNLTKLGFVADAEAVLRQADGKLPSGELIAEVMLSDAAYYSPLLLPYMKGGARSDMPYINFYLDYFAQGKPAFVPISYMRYEDTIELIKDNGGVPVVAHPGLNLKGKEPIVERLLDKGAEGLEIFNNYHSMEQIGYFAPLVRQREAVMTCGSDFHGRNKPLLSIGQFRSDSQYEEYVIRSADRLRQYPTP